MTNLGNQLTDGGSCEAVEVNAVVEAGEVEPLSNDVIDDNRTVDDRDDNGETRA